MAHSHVTWRIHMRNVTHWRMRLDFFTSVTWLIHMWHNSFTFDMTHSHMKCRIHMWLDSFICDMTHSYVTCRIRIWNAAFICDLTHSHVAFHMCDVNEFPCTRAMISWTRDTQHMWHDSLTSDVTWLSHISHNYLRHALLLLIVHAQ